MSDDLINQLKLKKKQLSDYCEEIQKLGLKKLGPVENYFMIWTMLSEWLDKSKKPMREKEAYFYALGWMAHTRAVENEIKNKLTNIFKD